MANQQILDMALKQMEQTINPVTLTAWFDDAQVVSFSGNLLVLHVPNDFKKEIIENRFIEPLKEALNTLLADDIKVKIISGEVHQTPDMIGVPNDTYTFDHFIVGSSNKFAHAAATAVSKKPASVYNPLFIYGHSGLGKTHLLYAIAHELRITHSSFKIVYVKGEDFTNELVTAIQDGQMQNFREKYRTADLFLIDDIQFIAGKERTQEEFFHTFNAIYEANRQIVLTSDRPPKEINTLEDRLRTRFEMGLLADIQPPDYETRLAIIRSKASQYGYTLPQDVTHTIADGIQSNVRQLEGVVQKIKAKHELNKQDITVELAKEIIEEVKTESPGLNPTPQMIMQAVANYYCIPVEQITSNKRSKDTVQPRQVSMYLVRNMLNYSLPEIGKIFSRDHTTVLHAVDKVKAQMKTSAEMNDILKTLTENIRSL